MLHDERVKARELAAEKAAFNKTGELLWEHHCREMNTLNAELRRLGLPALPLPPPSSTPGRALPEMEDMLRLVEIMEETVKNATQNETQ